MMGVRAMSVAFLEHRDARQFFAFQVLQRGAAARGDVPELAVVVAEFAHRGGGIAAAHDAQAVDLGQRLRTGIESIHNFGQRSCTLFVETHMAYPQDQSDFYEDIITALLGRSRRK